MNEELRRLAYSTAETMLKSQHDFMLFVKYCVDISVEMNGENRKGWGKGLRKMIARWYAKFTPVELANLFGEHRGLFKWSHRDLWILCHIKYDTPPPPAEGASAQTATAEVDPAEGPSAAATSAEGASVEVPATATDREIVAKFIYKDGQEYLRYLETVVPVEGTLQPGALRMRELQLFKTNESPADAVAKIQQHGFSLEQTPPHLLHHAAVWEALLPSLSYRELLLKLYTLKDLGFLNAEHPFSNKIASALVNMEHCDRAVPAICPIYLFILKTFYEKNVRYLDSTKAEKYEKKMTKRKVKPNPLIIKQLNIVFEHTLLTAKSSPANFMIVMDLRQSNLRRKYFIIFS